MSAVKISIERIGKQFAAREPVTAIADIDLEVRDGELVTLVGPSGCGKSTLLDLLAGLTRPTSGRVLIDGQPIDGPGLDRGIVFQQYALLPWRTARANVEFGLEAKGVKRKERHERAREFLSLVGLSGFEDRYPHELSGGMRQRVAIARSLAYDPEVLLMDEPFAALDAQTREVLQGELLRIWEQTRKTIVFITHGIDEAVYLGQRVVVLTSRPGTIKEVVDIDLPVRRQGEDLRSSPEFVRQRHHVWELLRDEVVKSQLGEAPTTPAAAAPRFAQRREAEEAMALV
jgi:NitT/TauT family transport system ATP-binding protein